MDYFEIAKQIVREHQAENLKKLEAGKCIVCGKADTRPEYLNLCQPCYAGEVEFMILVGGK